MLLELVFVAHSLMLDCEKINIGGKGYQLPDGFLFDAELSTDHTVVCRKGAKDNKSPNEIVSLSSDIEVSDSRENLIRVGFERVCTNRCEKKEIDVFVQNRDGFISYVVIDGENVVTIAIYEDGTKQFFEKVISNACASDEDVLNE